MPKAFTTLSFLLALIVASASHGLPTPGSPTVMVDTSTGAYCTVFPISSDGYMLTAAHCLKRCLDTDTAICKDFAIPSLRVSAVTVVAKGAMDSRSSDFALLKVETGEKLSCLKVSPRAPTAGQTLWAVGFPIPKTKSAPLAMTSTSGRVYAGAEESRYYKAQTSKASRERVAQEYSEPGVIYSDAHHKIGQSGGPVLVEDGSVIGVISGFTVTRSGKTEIHELVAGSTEKILSSLPTALAASLIQKSAACN